MRGEIMKSRNIFLKHLFIFISGFLLWGQLTIFPCTVAVVSGKATPDGRPLMWKNRDTSGLDNKIIYFKGAKYAFIGLIAARDKKAENVWAGINTEGFAIMNSASGDLSEGPGGKTNNGRFMASQTLRRPASPPCGFCLANLSARWRFRCGRTQPQFQKCFQDLKLLL